MSTSDSDYSIDWLASDEDDYDSPKRLSPPHAGAPPAPLTSVSSTTSLRESPSNRLHPGAPQRRRRRRRSDCGNCKEGGCCGGNADFDASLQTPAVSPLQGFTSTCRQQQTLWVEATHPAARKRAADGRWETPDQDADRGASSHKCMELQCYVQPLSSILRGLRSGRYSERLSSFQESVAMDRIQRIMGVLQNPHIGGRFLSTIMKIEEMLRSWFPHVRPAQTADSDGVPAKKPKLCSGASSAPASPASLGSSDVDLTGSYCSTHLKWLHTSPICSLKLPESTLPTAPSPPLARRHLEVTQDNAVSSSSDSLARPPRHLGAQPRLSQMPLPSKISSPCLERLLQAKGSIITPRTVGEGGCSS
ncbi:uncharacterized protein ACBR49_003505 [Aulostomus maculatus]